MRAIHFLCSHTFHKIENYFSFEELKKKIWPNFQRITDLFTQEIVSKFSKIWAWDPGSEIRKRPIPDPGSRGQKGTGSRIRNTAGRIRNALKFSPWTEKSDSGNRNHNTVWKHNKEPQTGDNGKTGLLTKSHRFSDSIARSRKNISYIEYSTTKIIKILPAGTVVRLEVLHDDLIFLDLNHRASVWTLKSGSPSLLFSSLSCQTMDDIHLKKDTGIHIYRNPF